MTDTPDARSVTSAANGKAYGGCPPGTERPDRTTYDPEPLAEAAANRILSGSPLVSARTGHVTDDDKRLIARITGEPAEAFQARITAKLELMADKTAELIFEKLADKEGKPGVDTFRPDTLPSLLAIALDKLQALSGRATSIGSVNIQINHANTQHDRPSVMSNLKGLRGDKADAIPVWH